MVKLHRIPFESREYRNKNLRFVEKKSLVNLGRLFVAKVVFVRASRPRTPWGWGFGLGMLVASRRRRRRRRRRPGYTRSGLFPDAYPPGEAQQFDDAAFFHTPLDTYRNWNAQCVYLVLFSTLAGFGPTLTWYPTPNHIGTPVFSLRLNYPFKSTKRWISLLFLTSWVTLDLDTFHHIIFILFTKL